MLGTVDDSLGVMGRVAEADCYRSRTEQSRYFAKEMSAAGVHCTTIGLEAPSQIGKTERHGGMWKATAKRAVYAQKIIGEDMALMPLSNDSVLNDGPGKGGFAPSQWVFCRLPRNPGNIILSQNLPT